MNDTKPWWESKGVWGGLVGFALMVLALCGYPVEPQTITEMLAYGAMIGSGFAGLFASVGRIVARKRIR